MVERLLWEPPGYTQMVNGVPTYQNEILEEAGPSDDDSPAEEEAEENEGDVNTLMRNGVQLGDLRQDDLIVIQEELRQRVERARRRHPGNAKDLLMMVGAAVARNRRSLVPAVRQACVAIQEKLDELMTAVATEKVKASKAERSWTTKFWKRVRARCRARAAQKRRLDRGRNSCPHRNLNRKWRRYKRD